MENTRENENTAKIKGFVNELDLIEVALSDAVSAAGLAFEIFEEEPENPILYVCMIERALPLLRTAFRVMERQIEELNDVGERLYAIRHGEARLDSAEAEGRSDT